MILQRDDRLRFEIREYGCYYMSLLYLANKYTNAPLSVERINGPLYFGAIQQGAMNTFCFIQDPDAILAACGWKAKYTGVHEPPEYFCKENECEILRFEHGKQSHFVVGDGHSHVTYDPMGVSETVRHGRLMSKRIFRLP